MEGVDPRLQEVVKLAIKLTTVDFGVSEGVRSLERQKLLYEQKKSKTMKSYHLVGKAVDVFAVVSGEVSWKAIYYHEIAIAMKAAAKKLGYTITWGGDFKAFFDAPHFQLEDK